MLNAAMNTEKYDYTTEEKDENGKPITVPIPARFAPTGIEGENTVKDGFVITDSAGNEFVWIPVTSAEQYVRNENYQFQNVSSTAYDDDEYLPDGITNELETVKTAGGFYIGRYEAGAEGGKLEKIEQGETLSNSWTEEPMLVCKKRAIVYNYITEETAKTKAKGFVNNSDVKSALISGRQWDVTMKFINGKKDGNGNTFNVEQADSSRHTNSLEKSGQNEADKVCNIYDLEGNCRESIAEKNSSFEDNEYVIRGGNPFSNGIQPASLRVANWQNAYGSGTFRLVLYVIEY